MCIQAAFSVLGFSYKSYRVPLEESLPYHTTYFGPFLHCPLQRALIDEQGSEFTAYPKHYFSVVQQVQFLKQTYLRHHLLLDQQAFQCLYCDLLHLVLTRALQMSSADVELGLTNCKNFCCLITLGAKCMNTDS